ncbi:hypothetical protein SacmaDRAFT_3953 [Saccharomonospora marina XMU15]|uniref:Uncharacterized protein n=1 Tax=Saccharomonospora marina XMU15 TaxID=882083 RepID=H5X3T3_9PSEU|nr:hypothetical protein [Saccharomonospora marina]EHR52151.1 hypothetical protein SacmaDRAFT_3953 [Saccharomonospora marina XMU15]
MAGHQVDRAIDAVDAAMRELKRSLRGIPIRREGFKSRHDRMAKAVAKLTVALEDSRPAIND